MLLTASGVTFHGRLSENEELFVAASSDPGPSPHSLAGVRKGIGHSAASLNRTYAFFGRGPTNVSLPGSATFDGVGGTNVTFTENNGAAVPMVGMSPGTYTVGADDAFVLVVGANTYEGGVAVSGELVLAGGETTGVDSPLLLVFMLQSAGGPTAATFAGSYLCRALSFNIPSSQATSWSATCTADGAGGLSVAGQQNVEGVQMPLPATAHTYVVAPTGAMVVSSMGQDFQGQIAQDGSVVVFAGPTNVPGQPEDRGF